MDIAPGSQIRFQGADLFGDIEPAEHLGWRDLFPGLLVVLLGTLAAGFLSDHYGAPLTLMSLLIGLALNFLSADKRLNHGFAFASRSLLRWGIVLVAVRVTAANRGPNLFHQNRTVSWQSSIPRSNIRSSTLCSDRGKRTYIMTTRRITSGWELKRRNGLEAGLEICAALTVTSTFGATCHVALTVSAGWFARTRHRHALPLL